VREFYLKRQIGDEHALLICRQPESSQRSILEFLKRQIRDGERSCTIEDLREYLAESELLPLKKAPFATADAKLVPGAGACSTCPKRTGNAPLLFGEDVGDDVCTDRKCYDGKVQAHIHVTLEQLTAQAQEQKQPAPLRLSTNWEAPKGMVKTDSVASAKPGSCPSVRKAIVVHAGRHDRDESHYLGTVHTVCDNQSCAVHRPGRSGIQFDSSPGVKPIQAVKAERKRELQLLTRRLAIVAAADKAKWDSTMLRLVTSEMWARLRDTARHVPFWMGWEKKPLAHADHEKYMKRIRALNDKELIRFLTIITLADTWESTWWGSRGGDPLPPFAKHCKVDLRKLEAQARVELKPKWGRSDKARAGKLRKMKERMKQAKQQANKQQAQLQKKSVAVQADDTEE